MARYCNQYARLWIKHEGNRLFPSFSVRSSGGWTSDPLPGFVGVGHGCVLLNQTPDSNESGSRIFARLR